MAEMKHTPEPWIILRNPPEFPSGYVMVGGDKDLKKHENLVLYSSNASSMPDWLRIVACVNACKGMADPQHEIERLKARVAELEANNQQFIVVEGGGDWDDASVDYFVNLSGKNSRTLYREYQSAGGYYGTELVFVQWIIKKGYCREATDSDTHLDVIFEE